MDNQAVTLESSIETPNSLKDPLVELIMLYLDTKRKYFYYIILKSSYSN